MRSYFIRWISAVAALFVILLFIPSLHASPEKTAIQVIVDPRVELFSIIFRLAGSPEYKEGRVPGYKADVDKHFRRMKRHSAVKLARSLRRNKGISYNAPMDLAVHLTDAFTLKEKVPLNPLPVYLDDRWTSRSVVGGGASFPEVTGKPVYNTTRTVLTIPVKLKPAWRYELGFNSKQYLGFVDENGIPLKPFPVRFKTRDPP